MDGQADAPVLTCQETLPLGDAVRRSSSEPSLPDFDARGQFSADETYNGPLSDIHRPSVEVEVLTIPHRGGRRRKVEPYPFSTIKVAWEVADGLQGESFLIPDDHHPKRHIAVARKRYGPAGKTFETRVVPGGVRVWRKS